MSLPNIPQIPQIPVIPTNAAISLILVSIALEEIGLSHIINAEGEKIQSAVAALNAGKASVCDVLAIDKSVSDLLRTILKKEVLIGLKMSEALEVIHPCPEPPPHTPCPTTYNPCDCR